MKTLTNPAYFSFTNRIGESHSNKSLLKSRIEMMNRQSSWRSWWRYVAIGMVLFFTVMCQNISEQAIPVEGGSDKTGNSSTSGIILGEDNSKKVGDTRYLVSKNGKLYGVITPYATEKDIEEIGKILAKYHVPFQLLGVQRDEEGRIFQIKDVVLGDYGSEAMKVVKKQKSLGNLKLAFFDFCYDPEFGCYPNIHPGEFPNSLSQTMLQEGVISNGSITKQLLYEPLLKDKMNGIKRGINLTRTEMESTWTGNMNQLLEASFFKRKGAMLYVRPDKHLDLYDEYKKSVTIFVDQKQVTLKELREIHIRQVAIVYAHKRQAEKRILGISNRTGDETDYVVWIDRAPNRMKRDSTIHVVSPFYTGDF